jgi:hypothetical protein
LVYGVESLETVSVFSVVSMDKTIQDSRAIEFEVGMFCGSDIEHWEAFGAAGRCPLPHRFYRTGPVSEFLPKKSATWDQVSQKGTVNAPAK